MASTLTVTPPPRNDSPGAKTASSKKREADATPDSKPKRTRTGCLTCRERHLKCDETKPTCNNCAKSQRDCNWGKKLNFLDTTCEKNAYLIPKGNDYCIAFQDESRIIAGEYVGGQEMYPLQDAEPYLAMAAANFPMGPPGGRGGLAPPAHHHLPPIHDMSQDSFQQAQHPFTLDHQRPPQHNQRTRKSQQNHRPLHTHSY